MKFKITLSVITVLFSTCVFAQSTDAPSYSTYEGFKEETPTASFVTVDPREVSHKTGYETEPIRAKNFDPKKWKEIVGNERYSWDETEKDKKDADRQRIQSQQQHNRDSLAEKSQQRMEQSEYDEPEDTDVNIPAGAIILSPILKIIFYLLMIGVIGYILFLVLKNVSLTSRGKKISNAAPSNPSEHVEDIKELEIDRLLREAMASGDYRLAVRICFLGLLKKLDEDGLIVWKKDKTNRDYLTELLSQSNHVAEIRSVTLAYEQVWYGDHDFPKHTYEQILSSFKEIDQKLNASKTR